MPDEGQLATSALTAPRPIFIVGPTGSGKTGLALSIAAQHGHCEVVNCDVLQIYKGRFSIGLAKPTDEEQAVCPHHLFDCLDYLDASMNVKTFVQLCLEAIDGVVARGNTPLVVGGSMMYVDKILWTSELDSPTSESPSFADAVQSQSATMSAGDELQSYEDLKTLDPISASRIHPNDSRRISIALQKARGGKARSTIGIERTARYPDSLLVTLPRAEKTVLTSRVCHMVSSGLLDEALEACREVHSGAATWGRGMFGAICYKEFERWATLILNGVSRVSADAQAILRECIDKVSSATNQYSRKQNAWCKIIERKASEENLYKLISGVPREEARDGILRYVSERNIS